MLWRGEPGRGETGWKCDDDYDDDDDDDDDGYGDGDRLEMC